MKKENTNILNVRDFEYILEEITRFSKGYYQAETRDARKDFLESEPKYSSLCKMPSSLRPEGEVAIGQHADDRFFILAKRIRAPKNKKALKNVTYEQLVSNLKFEFSKQIVEQGKAIEESIVSKIISKSISMAISENKAITHYIPLFFFADYKGEELDFGGIRLIGVGKFISMCLSDKKLKEKFWSCEHFHEYEFEEYFSKFNAIICVEVPACEKRISRDRAMLAAKVFVGIAQLFSGRKNSQHIGIYEQASKNRGVFEVVNETGDFNITEHHKFGGAWVEGWREFLNPNYSDLSNIYSQTIDEILTPKQNEVLANRLIDSILWFSEAVSDRSDLSRIVKYSIAIERLLTTQREDVSKNIEERASKLLSIFDGDRDEWKVRVKDMYELRSNIVHGTLSISASIDKESDYWPEVIAKNIIMATTIFYSKLDIERNIAQKALTKKFNQLELF